MKDRIYYSVILATSPWLPYSTQHSENRDKRFFFKILLKALFSFKLQIIISFL